jgi:hypothetical protein
MAAKAHDGSAPADELESPCGTNRSLNSHENRISDRHGWRYLPGEPLDRWSEHRIANESLGTRDRAEATTLLNASNESVRQPQLNLHIAKAYLTGH